MIYKLIVFLFIDLISSLTYNLNSFIKRDFIIVNNDISVSTSINGLTSTIIVDINYDYNITVEGYVVSPIFDIEVGDYGYTVVTEYNDLNDLVASLDMWQFIHVVDNGPSILLTPDCSNTFYLLSQDTDELINWDYCYSIGSLSDDFHLVTDTVSDITTSTTTLSGTTIATATLSDAFNLATDTVSDISTATATVPCPLCTGEPTTYFIFTESETVSGTTTLYTTVPCSTKTGWPLTEPLSEIVYTRLEAVSNGVTVTSTVPCDCTREAVATSTGATGAGAETTPTGTAMATTPTTPAGTGTTATASAASESPDVYQVLTTTISSIATTITLSTTPSSDTSTPTVLAISGSMSTSSTNTMSPVVSPLEGNANMIKPQYSILIILISILI